MTEILAYEWEGLTFCPECALRASNLGLVLVYFKSGTKPDAMPQSMDEVIATMALMQVENNLPIITPIPTYLPQEPACGSCGKEFPATQREAS